MSGRLPRSARRYAALVWFLLACGLVPLPANSEPYEANPDAAARDPDYAAGKRAIEKQDWPEAARRFAKAAAGDPDNPDLQNYLGFSNRKLKRFDLALKYYKRAIELDPRHRGAHEYIGETYLLVGDLPNAEKHLAALHEICLLSCEELEDLERAVAQYRARSGATTR
jgi:tetratricopeptide (TPR) repeat protein